MNWDEYKSLCESPCYFSRWALSHSLESVSEEGVRSRLKALLEQSPLEKPADHTGGAATDFMKVDVDDQDARHVLEGLQAAANAALPDQEGRYRHLCVVWQEYIDALADSGRD